MWARAHVIGQAFEGLCKVVGLQASLMAYVMSSPCDQRRCVRYLVCGRHRRAAMTTQDPCLIKKFDGGDELAPEWPMG